MGIITCQKYNAHIEPLFKKLSLPKLNDLFRLNVLKLYYKFNNGLLPIYVANLFQYDTGNDHYDLRNENILINPEAKHEVVKIVFVIISRALWIIQTKIFLKKPQRIRTKVSHFILKETWSAVMLLAVQSRIVIYAQEAPKLKKKKSIY